MTELSNIVFYQVYKRPPRKKKKLPKGRKWEVTKTKIFLDKVKVIRMRAEEINRKLINY
jgi:hypothetical protein